MPVKEVRGSLSGATCGLHGGLDPWLGLGTQLTGSQRPGSGAVLTICEARSPSRPLDCATAYPDHRGSSEIGGSVALWALEKLLAGRPLL